jgi:hypothetical protein
LAEEAHESKSSSPKYDSDEEPLSQVLGAAAHQETEKEDTKIPPPKKSKELSLRELQKARARLAGRKLAEEAHESESSSPKYDSDEEPVSQVLGAAAHQDETEIEDTKIPPPKKSKELSLREFQIARARLAGRKLAEKADETELDSSKKDSDEESSSHPKAHSLREMRKLKARMQGKQLARNFAEENVQLQWLQYSGDFWLGKVGKRQMRSI